MTMYMNEHVGDYFVVKAPETYVAMSETTGVITIIVVIYIRQTLHILRTARPRRRVR